MGPQQGQKVFTLQTLPASNEDEYGQLANTSGFSLHLVIFANVDESEKLKRPCRYTSRPTIREQRLGMSWLAGTTQRLKSVFNIDINECEKCQKHNVMIISCIIQPAITHKILLYLSKQGSPINDNNNKAPPLETLGQTPMVDDFII